MSQNLTISETGLKLIKAFEGYRPVDRELISGQRIVGYGHRLYSEDAMVMSKSEAETTLRSDLEPFEDMINSEVHAPLTQSQFDALCSFAFNIGPKAFLQSDTLRAINNGRPLDAANGLDIWRKAEIDGKIYVIDALMRRRTAEKALFLRTERSVPAGREDLPPIKDTTLTNMSTDDALPVFTAADENGVVMTAPYEVEVAPARRRDDGPARTLELSELDIIKDDVLTEAVDEVENLDLDLELNAPETQASDVTDLVNVDDIEVATEEDMAPRKSPIAAAATDIVARLDALIEDADVQYDRTEETWPDSLIDTDALETKDKILEDVTFDDTQANVIDLNKGETLASRIMKQRMNRREAAAPEDIVSSAEKDTPVSVIDELAQDDAIRVRTDSAAKYIETSDRADLDLPQKDPRALGLWIPVVLGFILVGLASGTMIKGSEQVLGEWGPISAFTGFVIGLGLILTGVYAALRMNLRD